jgi:hypothetical protein
MWVKQSNNMVTSITVKDDITVWITFSWLLRCLIADFLFPRKPVMHWTLQSFNSLIERFVLEFNSMVVETKGIWIASWLVIGRKTVGREWFFLHYNWKKAKAEDIPLVFSFFPSTFIPSRLHIVACPDIKDCEKMILPIFGKLSISLQSLVHARWNLLSK